MFMGVVDMRVAHRRASVVCAVAFCQLVARNSQSGSGSPRGSAGGRVGRKNRLASGQRLGKRSHRYGTRLYVCVHRLLSGWRRTYWRVPLLGGVVRVPQHGYGARLEPLVDGCFRSSRMECTVCRSGVHSGTLLLWWNVHYQAYAKPPARQTGVKSPWCAITTSLTASYNCRRFSAGKMNACCLRLASCGVDLNAKKQ